MGLEDRVLVPDSPTYATMRDQIERLRRLSGDLREVSLAEEHALGLVFAPCDLADVAHSACSAAAPRFAAADVELRVETGSGPLPCDADAVRLAQS